MRILPSAPFRWGLFLTVALGWRLLLFVGPLGSDDIAYSEAAWEITARPVPSEAGIHGLRLGYVSVIGLLYAVFGAGSFSLVAFNLASSLAEIVLAWRIAREFLDEQGAWIASSLVAFLPIHVFLSTEAHPDLPLAALTSLSVLLFIKARDRTLHYVASGAALGLAYLMKESAFLGFAALLVLAGRPRPRQLWVLAGFAGGLLIEAAFLGVLTGDPLYRIHAVQALQEGAMNSEYYFRSVPTLRRVFVDVPAMFFFPLSGTYTAFCLVPTAAVAGAILAFRMRDPGRWRLVLWPVALVCLLNFWPISLAPYRPALVAYPRVFVVVAVPLAILAALAVRRLRPGSAIAAGAILGLPLVFAAILLHSDGRAWSEGARRAYANLPERGPVVSDPRTTALFRLYDGYADSRPWLDWHASPETDHVRVVNGSWIRMLRAWYGIEPPPSFTSRSGTRTYESEVTGRIRFREWVAGRSGRGPAYKVTIVSVETSP